MERTKRTAAIGAIAGVAILALLAIGAFAYRSYQVRGKVDDPAKVVVVFAIEGEDGAPIAHTVVVVKPGDPASPITLADTSATVSVPGLSDGPLRNVYPLVGAEGVATALDGGTLGSGSAWVDVPPAAWRALLRDGVDVTLAEGFDTFDGERFVAFPAGAQHVSAEDLWALANGIEYLPPAERDAVREAMARASLKALAAGEAPPKGTTANTTENGWGVFAAAARTTNP